MSSFVIDDALILLPRIQLKFLTRWSASAICAEPQTFRIYSITGMRGRPIWEEDLVLQRKSPTRTMGTPGKGLAGKDNQSKHRRLANISAAGILLCEWHD